MPDYIEVKSRTKPRASGAQIEDEPAHYVDVFIGPAILGPFETLLSYMAESHDDNMAFEGGMDQHRREEPKCTYCAAIHRAQKTLRAIKGKAL